MFHKTEDTMISSLQWRAAALLVFGVIASTTLPPASAQTYPTKPVQLVVAFPPGGVGDIVARAGSDKLARALGQAVNVETRPVPRGVTGPKSVMLAAQYGFALLADNTREIAVNRTLGPKLPAEPKRPLKPVALFQPSMGAFIGRFANRIAKGRFPLEGKEYQLALNNGPNSLHGGEKGSRFQVFGAKQLSDSSVEMTHIFEDGEENYPGTLPCASSIRSQTTTSLRSIMPRSPSTRPRSPTSRPTPSSTSAAAEIPRSAAMF